jgi:rhamnulokinase
MGKLFEKVESKVIYEKTGIQFLQFNTIYQLYEHVKAHKEIMNEAETFLMVPDYLNFLLSGKKDLEFTNATSTQLFNVHNNQCDEDLIHLTGLDPKVFPRTVKPGTVLGRITEEIQEKARS